MPDDEQDDGAFEEFDDADVTEGSNQNLGEGEAEEERSDTDSEATGDTVENGYAAAETTATESTDETGTAEGNEASTTAGVAGDRGTDAAEPAESGDSRESGDRPEKSPDEVYCSSCGAVIKREAEICPECGVRQGAVSGGRTDEKNPGLSALASFIIPGAGQVYNGQISRGGVFLAALVLLWSFYMVTLGIGILLGIFIEPVLHIIAAYDAYNQANKINAGEVQV